MNENPETKSIETVQTESMNTLNINRHNNDTKILEFMQDLKEAIQSGEFQRYEQHEDTKAGHETETDQENGVPSSIASLINVNNLSNQTFNYIINWLKQQQLQQLEENKETIKQNSDSDFKFDPNSEQAYTSETQMLRSQMRLVESEKEQLVSKFKELQEENVDLKSKVIALKNSAGYSAPVTKPMMTQSLGDKDFEIERLKQIIDELIKSNEEKEKRLDDLSKQVLRFKRIQEIVLSAQTGCNPNYKNKIDLDFDTNSDSNSIPSINGDDLVNQILSTKAPTTKSSSKNGQPLNQVTSPKQYQNGMSNPMVLASNINQACSLISSCSLSSSLSSSSTASSNSSTSSTPNNNNTNNNNLVAPLATISELNNTSCSNDTYRKSQNMEHYNTLPSSLNNLNDSKKTLNDTNDIEMNKYRSLNKLNSCKTSSNNSSNTMVNESLHNTEHLNTETNTNDSANFTQNLDMFKISNKNKVKGSVNSLNNDIIQKVAQQTEKNDKYLSTCSNTRSKNSKKQSSVPPQNKTSPSHNSNSIKNFFGKLIRTSLVNINESSFNNTMDKYKKSSSMSKHDNNDGSLNRSSFKRGGTRATANARLQNNSFSLSSNCLTKVDSNNKMHYNGNELNTFTFAKWTSDQVYEWLNRNGFENYFSFSSDGRCHHKWIKNGLHLLQASQQEYEKELGIKNALHRKRLSLLLQSMYNVASFTQLELNYTNFIDQLWVTKWLDDIGLPQYKDIFHDSKIDGMMLNNLTNEDLHQMNIQSELHYLSIKRAIHVLRLKEFDPNCLRRRPSGDEFLDKSEVILWTNHRVMEWLRSIDLSEYAPNLRGSGVHGALMVFDGRFNSTVLADILAIPASKTLLRRHLTSLFNDLIGQQMSQLKRDTESQPNYHPLSASTKLKLNKRGLGVSLFSHKRTKSQDREFLSAPILQFNDFKNYDNMNGTNLSGPVNEMIQSFREETTYYDKELSMSRKTKTYN